MGTTGACLRSGSRWSRRCAREASGPSCRGGGAWSTALSAASIDRRAARRAFGRAAAGYAEAAMLAREVEARMRERLQYIKLAPERILDAGCADGHGARQLAEAYPQAQVVGLDFALPMLSAGRGRRGWIERVFRGDRVDYLCADFACVPLPAASVDLAWSNLALHYADDPRPALKELHRVLKVGGLLQFCCYGPDTLKELRRAFAAHDAAAHVHDFLDMHDLGDMLAACSFADPVMDMELITLTYTDIEALMAELRANGQTNVLAGRGRGLTGKGVFSAMRAAYETARVDGRLPASFEIIYGHAWKPRPRLSAEGHSIVTMQPRLANGN